MNKEKIEKKIAKIEKSNDRKMAVRSFLEGSASVAHENEYNNKISKKFKFVAGLITLPISVVAIVFAALAAASWTPMVITIASIYFGMSVIAPLTANGIQISLDKACDKNKGKIADLKVELAKELRLEAEKLAMKSKTAEKTTTPAQKKVVAKKAKQTKTVKTEEAVITDNVEDENIHTL